MGVTNLLPEQSRAQDGLFVSQCNLLSLQGSLPLHWPTPAGVPASPKKRYRSSYVYPWKAAVANAEQVLAWRDLSTFDLLLRLVDFSGLRPVLANLLGWKSGRGWEPFDPISFFLLLLWQINNHWSRSQLLHNLAEERYADYAGYFGFQPGVYPSEGGIRYFLTTLGGHSTAGGGTVAVEQGECLLQVAVQKLNQLLAQAVMLLRQASVLSPETWNNALLCPDGQIHDAASRLRCISVSDTCYQPYTPDQPRLCPAKSKDRQGCDCDTLACAQTCCHATPRDREARFVVYAGHNQSPDNPNTSTSKEKPAAETGEARYGYRSLPLRLADPLRRFSLTLLDDVRPANEHEEVPSAALLLQLKDHYPDLHVDAVAGDAGFGYEVFLHTVHSSLHARRVVDRRSHSTDQDREQWTTRGYDDQGRPICQFGYAFNSYGFERERQRHKWCCDKACLRGQSPAVRLSQVHYPPPECPFQDATHQHGRVLHIGERFADGSIRLVRDLPFASPTWKALYRRARNAVESRNATFEAWGYKRLPVFGLLRSKALIFLADVLDTLTTLARLVRDATLASRSP